MASKKNDNFENGGDEGGIEAERLCDAAEAALKAVVEVSQRNGGRWIYPTDIMLAGPHAQPACLSGYTTDEIEQASMFLVRMGIIEPRRAPRRAA